MNDIEKREQFEAWLAGQFVCSADAVLLHQNEDGTYVSKLTAALCEAFYGGIAAALSAAPQGVLEQHHRDSAELRRLCADRDQQRADKLEMAAEAASWAEEAGRLKALLNDAQVFPDGWVLVPAVPTPQMVRAGAGEVLISRLEASKVWAAMLASKPEPQP